MQPILMILVFMKWLQENPAIFLPTSWQHLPDLKEDLAELDNDELFPIAHTIGKWCAKHHLGEKLSQSTDWMEVAEPLDDNSKFPDDIENPIQLLRDLIDDRYQTFQSKFNVGSR